MTRFLSNVSNLAEKKQIVQTTVTHTNNELNDGGYNQYNLF